MKKPSNWENVKAAGDYVTLPAGGYICKILNAEEKEFQSRGGDSYSQLIMAIDIEVGDFKGFYADNYRTQQQEDKKWKGNLRYYLPKDDGSDKDEWTQRNLKALIEAVEDSNPGYHFDWEHPELLKGKKAGVLFRNEEWAFEGRYGWKAQPFKAVAVDLIQSAKFKIPADKPLNSNSNSNSGTSNNTFEEISDEVDGDDLPF